MERGIYDWDAVTEGRRLRRGSTTVSKNQILRDCKITTNYAKADQRIWKSEEFQKLLKQERARRDHAIVEAVQEIEAVSGPIKGIGDKLITLIVKRLEEDPDELTTKELLQYGPQWVRLGFEVEGKLESQKAQGIEHVLSSLYQGNKVTSGMLDQALDLVREYRELQDRKLENAGMVIEGEGDE
jgi:hypothetical protein